MTSWIRPPKDATLDSAVEAYWFAEDRPIGELILPPAASNDLVVSVVPPTTMIRGDQRQTLTGHYASGVRSEFFRVDQHGHFRLLGVRFRPWVFALRWRLPPAVHGNRFSTWESLGQPFASGVSWEAWAALESDPDALVPLLDREVAALLPPAAGGESVLFDVQRAIGEDKNSPVTRLAGRAGVSVSTLERLTRSALGVSPKVWGRIVRYTEVWNALHRPGIPRWAEISADLGYFDQAHFIREFQRFTGETPDQYRQHRRSTLDRYRLFDENVQSSPGHRG